MTILMATHTITVVILTIIVAIHMIIIIMQHMETDRVFLRFIMKLMIIQKEIADNQQLM
jgi:hypothetical protein